MYNFFLKIHYFFKRKKIAGFSLLVVLAAVLVFFASKIKLEEDITQLIPSGESNNVLRRVLDETQFSDKIIVTISASSEETHPDRLTRYAEEFIDSINAELPQYIEEIEGELPEEGVLEVYDFVYDHLPLFLNSEDYQEIGSRITEDSIGWYLRKDYRNLISPTGLVTKEFIFKDPLSVTNLGLNKLRELQVGNEYELYNNFLLTKDRQHLLLFLSPTLPASETSRNKIFINKLKEIQSSLDKKYEEVEGDIFGGVLYSLANANRIKADIWITVSIAVALLLLLLIFFYRRITAPIIIFLPSMLGALVAVVFLYFFKGTISTVSLGIGALLLGISLDYALHTLTHYRNNKNISQLYKDVTRPVLMSSLTTSVAFLCLLFVDSQALHDLGIFGAISFVATSIFALIFVPLLYKLPVSLDKEKPRLLDWIASVDLHKKTGLVITTVFLFLFGLLFFTGVDFNSELSRLSYEPDEVQNAEGKILEIAGRSGETIFLVSYGSNVDEALLHNYNLYSRLQEMQEEGKIENFSSIGGVVLSTNTQTAKISNWDEFWNGGKKEQLKQDLIEQSEDFGFKEESFNTFYRQLEKDFNPILLDDYRNTANLYLNDFISVSPDFATVTTTVNLPEGSSLNFSEELEDIEGIVVVDKNEISQAFLGNLKNEFNQLIGISIFAVFLVLLLFYKNLELSILTILPVAITWVISLGIMSVLGIEFNILNIIISTFIFGLGLDYSIFITNGALKEYEEGRPALKTYRTSILISVLTTLMGIGALVFAKHPALRSVSVVSAIGVLTAVFVAFVFQAFIFDFLFHRRAKKGLAPFRLRNLVSNPEKKVSFKNQLYFKKLVLDNYRFKSVYGLMRKTFSEERERFLRISGFIEDKENLAIYNSGYGMLAIYLSYKHPENRITGFETEESKLRISKNAFRNGHELLSFTDEISALKDAQIYIIERYATDIFEKELKEMISKSARKVIILDPEYSYRWILDLNFEITYRQNNIIELSKLS
ncbi:MMPL family transporter [Zunongwangia sp. F363]|uniref:MMPL family transporter n=1 Tax=Autumnicola tepida TaxID=3075595 RepID=A0ABU3C6R7_9FLAO|nr:MMPL family transporter [Zunongwangia sp. F363]MDT0641877.1 MMPL family transporter [Zunongwangia sp. F363]